MMWFEWFHKKKKLGSKKEWIYKVKALFRSGDWEQVSSRGPRSMMKIYMWFLIRESPKYSIKYKNGRSIWLRKEIVKMEYCKILE